MLKYYIYKITCNVNKKIYIGYTKNPESRWKGHKHVAKNVLKQKSKLYNAMRKYGIDKFNFELIYESEDMTHCKEVMEPKFILEYNSIENGYNIAPGGSGGATRTGMPFTVEQRKKISKSVKNAMTEDVRKIISEKATGRLHTEETKTKMSKLRKKSKWISHIESEKTRFVPEEELNYYLSEGWIAGRKFNNALINSGTNYRNKS